MEAELSKTEHVQDTKMTTPELTQGGNNDKTIRYQPLVHGIRVEMRFSVVFMFCVSFGRNGTALFTRAPGEPPAPNETRPRMTALVTRSNQMAGLDVMLG
jgi:hypothetical protein